MAGRACPTCGVDVSALTPRDAAAAVRSYPRRFRAALADAGADAGVHRRAVAGALARAAHDLYRVLVEDEPELTPLAEEPDGAGVHDPPPLDDAAEQLGALIDATSGDDWRRTGRRHGVVTSALDIVRDAVHDGAHHLRAIRA